MLKKYKSIIKEILLTLIFIVFIRIVIFPLIGIADISAIITNSMEHTDNWKINLYFSQNNIPCCFIASNFSKKFVLYPGNIIIPVINDKILINILKEESNKVYCSLNDCIFYNYTFKNNQSFIVFEKKLGWALLYVKYNKKIPFSNGIYRGDVVIVKKIKNPCKEINNYDVIEYNFKGFNLVHRVILKIYYNNTCIFIVKGDNSRIPIPNLETHIYPNQIVGKVVLRIPYLGMIHYVFFNLIGISHVLESKLENLNSKQ